MFPEFRARALKALCALLVGASCLLAPGGAEAEPIKLHPDNNRYFLLNGKPVVLVASGEHYGSVINLDFDYVAYLDTIKAQGLNLTRIFAGEFVENFYTYDPNCPPQERMLTPWPRSATPGYIKGGNKFDLSQWDATYFARLKDFVAKAQERGVVVEVTFFSAYYGWWAYSPLHPSNNIQGQGPAAEANTLNLSDARHTAAQEAMVAKIVTELNAYDNVYYEIANEPYLAGASAQWQARIAQRVASTEAALPKKHLIAQNITNGATTVSNPDPNVSIFNFHYALPEAVQWNYGLNKPIAHDENGFAGSAEGPYRKEAWRHMLLGGSVYNSIDWSFSTKSPTGNDYSWDKSLGAGGPALRMALGALSRFLNEMEVTRLSPGTSFIKSGIPVTAYAMSETGKQYVVFLDGGVQATLNMDLPAGSYRAQWLDTKSGAITKSEDFSHTGGTRAVSSPAYSDDVALRIRAISGGNILPSVSITSPQSGAFAQTGSSVTLSATATDPDGRIVEVAWYANGNPVGKSTSAPWSVSWTPSTGSYLLTAVALDNADGSSTSPPVSINVGASGAETFYRGINFNGDPVVIDGNAWEGRSAPNYSTNGQAAQWSVQFSPATDASRMSMLSTGLWNRNGMSVSITGVPAGTYKVYLYSFEDNSPFSFSLSLNGAPVQGNIYSGAPGQWQKLGPYTAVVNAGSLTLTSSAPADTIFSGIEIWRVGSDATPVAPTALLASADTASQVSIAWSDNSSNETGFRVERKTGSAGSWSEIGTTGANVSAYKDTGLAGGTTYFYRVRATSAAGDSAYSNEASATTKEALAPPSAPSSLSAAVVSPSQIALTWVRNSTNESGFRIESRVGSTGAWAILTTVSGGVLNYQVTGLQAGTAYGFRVKAVNAAGESAYSNEASATTSSPGPTAPVVALLSPTTGASLTLGQSVTLSASATDGAGIAKVEYFAAGTLVGSATVAPYSVPWTPGATGSFAVTAVATSTKGVSATSAPVVLTVAAAPAARTFYRAINLNGPAMTIDGNPWEAKSAANYSYTGYGFENQSVRLAQATDASRAQMIRSSIWNPNGSNVTLSNVPNGTYDVYLYTWEDNFPVTYTATVNGVNPIRITSGSMGSWQKVGPWTVTVTNGKIALLCTRGDANLSGIEVWRR